MTIMLMDTTYQEALKNAEHLVALGQAEVHLRDEGDFPWRLADDVVESGSYRFNGPTGCRIIAHERGLTLMLTVDFERRGANGMGYSMFDRDRLEAVMRKLPLAARIAFMKLLLAKVLPDLEKRTAEMQQALSKQEESESCVHELIELASKV